MKFLLALAIAAGAGFGAVLLWLDPEPQPGVAPTAPALATPQIQQAPSESDRPRATVLDAATPPAAVAETVAQAAPRRSPEELLNELATIQVTSGSGPLNKHRILSLLEQLVQEGPPALPALRRFLASGGDVAYRAPRGDIRSRGGSGTLPVSLRLGLFDVVQLIGGAQAEQILVESASVTSRGTELAFLVQLLEESAPDKYRDAALAAAHGLLASGVLTDRDDRDLVYDVLSRLDDTTYVSTAEAQLVQPDGRVDRSALRYLKETLGDQAPTLAARAYQDQRVTDADSKESLARVALEFVGANDQALDLYHMATQDPALKPDQRRNLVEDLNQDGLESAKNPTPDDLKIIARRYALTQTYLQQDDVRRDVVLEAAFREAAKDLANMLQDAGVPLPATPPQP
jgi:hypothetical protein